MPTYTRAEIEGMYRDYLRGWDDGTSGKPITAQIGTSAPQYGKEYRDGFEAGVEAFLHAMDAKHRMLVAMLQQQVPQEVPQEGVRADPLVIDKTLAEEMERHNEGRRDEDR